MPGRSIHYGFAFCQGVLYTKKPRFYGAFLCAFAWPHDYGQAKELRITAQAAKARLAAGMG
jgi:hypothetical protein